MDRALACLSVSETFVAFQRNFPFFLSHDNTATFAQNSHLGINDIAHVPETDFATRDARRRLVQEGKGTRNRVLARHLA